MLLKELDEFPKGVNDTVRLDKDNYERALQADYIDATGIDIFDMRQGLPYWDKSLDIVDILEKIKKDDAGDLIIWAPAWSVGINHRSYRKSKLDIQLSGDSSIYCHTTDPYMLFSPFTAPREGEDVSVWDCPRDIDVKRFNVGEDYRYMYNLTVKRDDSDILLVYANLYGQYPFFKQLAWDMYLKCCGHLHNKNGLTVVNVVSYICTPYIGYAASVWHSNTLYTMREFSISNLDKVAELIEDSGETVPADTDFETVIKSLPTSAIQHCESGDALLALIKSHM